MCYFEMISTPFFKMDYWEMACSWAALTKLNKSDIKYCQSNNLLVNQAVCVMLFSDPEREKEIPLHLLDLPY